MTLTQLFTSIANAIRTKKGTEALIQAEDFADEISTIQTGIDTSDATAEPINIRKDKTAYVDGQKITGTLPVLTYPVNPSSPSDFNYQFIAATSTSKVTREGTDYLLGAYQIAGNNEPDSWMFEGNRKMKMGIPVSVAMNKLGLNADYVILVNQSSYKDFNTTIRFPITINSNSKIEYKLRPLAHKAWSSILATSSSTHIQMENDANQVFFILNGSNVLPRYLAVDWSSAHTLTIDNNKFYIDGTLKSSSSSNMNTASWLEINTNSRQVNTRFYYLKIYSSGTLVHNYIPATVKTMSSSSSINCIYDTVTNQIVVTF